MFAHMHLCLLHVYVHTCVCLCVCACVHVHGPCRRSRDTVECDHCGHVVEERRRDVADVTISAKVDKMLCVVLDDLAEKTILEDVSTGSCGCSRFVLDG